MALLSPNRAPIPGLHHGNSVGAAIRISVDAPGLVIPGRRLSGRVAIQGLTFIQSAMITLRGFSTATLVRCIVRTALRRS